jgi:hypothetical protein
VQTTERAGAAPHAWRSRRSRLQGASTIARAMCRSALPAAEALQADLGLGLGLSVVAPGLTLWMGVPLACPLAVPLAFPAAAPPWPPPVWVVASAAEDTWRRARID